MINELSEDHDAEPPHATVVPDPGASCGRRGPQDTAACTTLVLAGTLDPSPVLLRGPAAGRGRRLPGHGPAAGGQGRGVDRLRLTGIAVPTP